MAETTKTRTLVELVLNQRKNSEFPELCIATNDEVAKNPQILSNVTYVKYPGPDFESSDGSDFRESAIRNNAPSNANSYLGRGRLTQGAVMCGDSYSAVVYLHIDEEQANRAPQLRREPRRRVEYDSSCDGEAD
jgi:hypothetical protein